MVRSCVKSDFLILFGNVARAMLVFSFALGRTRFLFGLRETDGVTRLSYRFAYRVEHRPPVAFPGAFKIGWLHRCSGPLSKYFDDWMLSPPVSCCQQLEVDQQY